MPRMVGTVLLAIGATVVVLALVGTVLGLRTVGAIEDATDSAVGASRQAADAVDGVLGTVESINRFVESLGGSSPLPDDLGIDRGLIDGTERTVDDQLTRARVLVVGGGVLLALTQVAPLWLGWALLDPARLRRALGLAAPTVPSSVAE